MKRLLLVLALLTIPAIARANFTNDSDPAMFGGHVAIGVGLNRPYAAGQIGLRIEEKHLFIGVELSSLLQNGFAADALLYFVKSKWFRLHLIDPGIGWNAFGYYLSTPYVKRDIDLRLGGGMEIRVWRHAYVTLDWKASFANPVSVIPNYGDYGRQIFVDSLKESQVWLGVLFH